MNRRGFLGMLVLLVFVALAAGGFFAYHQIMSNGVRISSGNFVLNVNLNKSNSNASTVSFTGNAIREFGNDTSLNATAQNTTHEGNITAQNMSRGAGQNNSVFTNQTTQNETYSNMTTQNSTASETQANTTANATQ